MNQFAMSNEELRAVANAPRSEGERILSDKAGYWARLGDVTKALSCAQASLVIYNDRMDRAERARTELARRAELGRRLRELHPWNEVQD